jgi:hypothetical protein
LEVREKHVDDSVAADAARVHFVEAALGEEGLHH